MGDLGAVDTSHIRRGRPCEVPRREIVNGILYVLRSGCPWRLLPNDLPAWGTVYNYFRKWQKQGVWDQVLEALRKQKRKKQGRDEEPSAAVIDSQSIKTSAVRGPEKGYDAGKKIWGRKKHLLVDTQGDFDGCEGDSSQHFGLVWRQRTP